MSRKRPGTDGPHGMTGYTDRLCRCEVCKAAISEYMRGWRAKNKAQGVPAGVPHGTNSTYSNYYCRCDECREAHSVYRKDRYVPKGAKRDE